MSKDRLEAFSDAVIAIIMTLLVLELRVPKIANHSSLGQYATVMTPLIPKFIIFALTFGMIANHWVSHHYFFRNLRTASLGLVWLNNLFLLTICFMPFPAAMLGDHPTDQFPLILFGVSQLLAAFTFFAFRSYATTHKLFVNTASAKNMGPRHSIPAIAIFTSAIILSFVSVYLSLACFLLVPLLYFVPTLIDSKLFSSGSRSRR